MKSKLKCAARCGVLPAYSNGQGRKEWRVKYMYILKSKHITVYIVRTM